MQGLTSLDRSLWFFAGTLLLGTMLTLIDAIFVIPPDLTNPGVLVSGLLGLAVAACGVFIVGLLGALFFLSGFASAYRGRGEFGPMHSRNMEVALAFLIVTIAVSVAASFLPNGTILALRGGFISANPASLEMFVSLGAILRSASALFAGLTLLFGVYAFAETVQALRLKVALALGAAGAVAGSLILVIGLYTQPPSAYDTVIIAGALGGNAVGVISMFLFALAYHRIRERIERGEVAPALPRPPPWPYYGPYPYPGVIPPPVGPPGPPYPPGP